VIKRPATSRVLRRLTLQGRFALLAALAVSVAVVAAAVISYFLVSAHLNQQIDQQLTVSAGSPRSPGGPGGPNNRLPSTATGSVTGSAAGSGTGSAAGSATGSAAGSGTGSAAGSVTGTTSGGAGTFPDHPTAAEQYTNCAANRGHDRLLGDPAFAGVGGLIIAKSDGEVCADNTNFSLGQTATATQIAVAKGQQNKQVYDTYTTSGTHVRAYTYAADGEPGYSYTRVIDLTYVDNSLHSLAIGLSFAALGGVALAAAAGFLVARSALKPVRRLTRAAEYVAATDDLSVQLPVDGADEMSRLGRAFNRMTKSLEASRERQQRLIADAGHELRTPLTSLRTNVDLLLRSRRTGRALPPGREESMLESVDQQLHELSGLVIDLLELSRSVEGGKTRTMRVALHESVGRAVDRAKLRGPGLEFDVRIEPWFVQGDPTGLDRAVVNLLDNAVKFSPARGKVTVRLERGQYTVADQGPGIDPADLPRVFERFYRSDSARSLPGSGLGLAIVAQVAEETGGSIKLEPAPGGGTLARLALPGDPGKESDRTADRT
jgi:two-component system sensor histidine kinase MprB